MRSAASAKRCRAEWSWEDDEIDEVEEWLPEVSGMLAALDKAQRSGTSGDGWEKLCPFLGMPVPAGLAFPNRH